MCISTAGAKCAGRLTRQHIQQLRPLQLLLQLSVHTNGTSLQSRHVTVAASCQRYNPDGAAGPTTATAAAALGPLDSKLFCSGWRWLQRRQRSGSHGNRRVRETEERNRMAPKQ